MAVFLGVCEIFYPTSNFNQAESATPPNSDEAALLCSMPAISVSWRIDPTAETITYKACMDDFEGAGLEYSETHEF